MSIYTLKFSGRRSGAIGINRTFVTSRSADTPEKAIEALYDAFENIGYVEVTQDGKIVYERGGFRG